MYRTRQRPASVEAEASASGGPSVAMQIARQPLEAAFCNVLCGCTETPLRFEALHCGIWGQVFRFKVGVSD